MQANAQDAQQSGQGPPAIRPLAGLPRATPARPATWRSARPHRPSLADSSQPRRHAIRPTPRGACRSS
jgi:hypothetical protein